MVRNVKPALIENCGIYSTHIGIPPYTYTVGNLNDNKYFGREGGGGIPHDGSESSTDRKICL